MDSQGFECQILEGFDQNLADKIQKVKFEVSGKYLRAQGCWDLFYRFRGLGFEIESEDGKQRIPEGNQYSGGIKYMLAVQKMS